MYTETNIGLECPYCAETIYESLSWFKKTYSTCPHCDKGLTSGQFSSVVLDLERAMEEDIAAMVLGRGQGGCCGKKSSCGCCAGPEAK